MSVTAVGVVAALAFLVVALTFVIFAFNIVDAGTLAYLAVPVGILVASGVSGLLVRWLTGRLYPAALMAVIAMLALSLMAIGWAILAVAASSVV